LFPALTVVSRASLLKPPCLLLEGPYRRVSFPLNPSTDEELLPSLAFFFLRFFPFPAPGLRTLRSCGVFFWDLLISWPLFETSFAPRLFPLRLFTTWPPLNPGIPSGRPYHFYLSSTAASLMYHLGDFRDTQSLLPIPSFESFLPSLPNRQLSRLGDDEHATRSSPVLTLCKSQHALHRRTEFLSPLGPLFLPPRSCARFFDRAFSSFLGGVVVVRDPALPGFFLYMLFFSSALWGRHLRRRGFLCASVFFCQCGPFFPRFGSLLHDLERFW